MAFEALFACGPAAAGLARHIQPYRGCQGFYRLREIQVLVVHHETQRVAAGATAKAIIELLLAVYAKRRCFFVVKGAAGAVIFARLFELNAPVHHFYDIQPIEQGIEKLLRNASGHAGGLPVNFEL